MDEPKISKMAMLRKLRRGSKDSIPVYAERSDSDFATLPSTSTAITPGRLTIFDLPGELRNHIYEYAASDIVLYLPSIEERRKKISIPVCGLLLASKCCRKEFLPLLYSTAPLVVDVLDFDFRRIMCIVGSLYSTELKAMRANNTLILHLRTLNCTRANMDGLRRWLAHRADSLDRLPWRYEVFVADTVGRAGCFRQSREVAYYGDRLARMQMKLEEPLQWELQTIVAAFDRKGTELHKMLQGVPDRLDPATRRIYGLSGGGLR
ncbi:ferrochelatase hem15 [Elasticomyces elasticus]|uniref:Ferrochelatase hem15 n=1 Tax=Elasticomyces elasticus TaxID=574655 RepID=A0AAN7ZYZ7_9PEZI|nr:ferrochelatase hem15 [Elasticomyces elasticus]